MRSILRNLDSRTAFFGTALVAFLVLGSSLRAGPESAAVDSTTVHAKNLARMNCGAQISWLNADGKFGAAPAVSSNSESAAALLLDDPSVSSPLPAGDTTYLISLSKATVLNRFTFINENASARGDLKIAVSNYQLPANSSKWNDVDGAVSFSHKRLFNLSLVGVEAKYVKLSFHVEQSGRIAGLGLYGGETLEAFGARQKPMVQIRPRSTGVADELNFNFANLYARSRIVYVSSGSRELAREMIDDNPATTFKFAATDRHPTVIVELEKARPLRRVSALHTLVAGRLEVYLLNDIRNSPPDFSGLKPVAVVEDTSASDKVGVDFDAQGAHYVALRWAPNAEATPPSEGFEIAEVGAFGEMPLASIAQPEEPDTFFASAEQGVAPPGEGSRDISSTLGTLAQPPRVDIVSP
jgi:hypothetical protein